MASQARILGTALVLLGLLGVQSVSAEEPSVPPDVAAAPPAVRDLLAPLASDRLFRTAKLGVHVVNVRTGEEVLAQGADEQLMPASTMKAVTAAVALHRLGPSYRFSTGLYRQGKIDGSGTLWGNLYIRGGGDPSLVVEELWKLVHDLKVEGVDRITGGLVFDETFFDTSYVLPGWGKPKDVEEGPPYYSYQGALSLNFNTVAVVIAPGKEVGAAARVFLETPAGEYVELVNAISTTGVGTRSRLEIERKKNGSKLEFKLSGNVAAEDGVRKLYRTVTDPTAHFMAAFKEMLVAQGIAVGGASTRGAVPEDARAVVVHRSRPLAAILMDMNKYSNNFIAEQVLRTMGAEVYGTPGTTDKGLQVVTEYLDGLGIPRGEYRLVNGSGLSRQIWIRPRHLTRILTDMANDHLVGQEYASSLAIGGRDGTLWSRFTEEPGRLRGKTGTIDGVHCLVGFVEGGDGERYAFAFMANGLSGGLSPVKRLHEQFARTMFNLGASADDSAGGGGQ